MTALSKRLEIEGPSRELDAEIAKQVLEARIYQPDPDGIYMGPTMRRNRVMPETPIPRFCESLDAAIAVFREVLPDHSLSLELLSEGECERGVKCSTTISEFDPKLIHHDGGWTHWEVERKDDHLAMALCAAICRARGL